jgi:hypothetical protein
MPFKHAIAASALVAIFVSGTPFAQTAADDAAAAQAYMRQKIDEATAADDKFHANRTQPNMIARDKAEAEAAEAIKKAHAATEKADAEHPSAAPATSPR